MAAPWFKIYAKELLSDSKILMLEDDQLGKLLKLWAFAAQDGSIPSDSGSLCKLLPGTSQKQMGNHLVWVNRFFAPMEGDPTRLISLRLLSEQKAYEEKCAKLKQNGFHGGRPKELNGSKKENQMDNQMDNQMVNTHLDNQMCPEVGSKKKEIEKDKDLTTAPPRKRAAAKAAKAPETLESILGEKGSPTWEAYWKLVAVFGPVKNPAPKASAKLYVYATVSFGFEHIHAKAEALAKSVSDSKYLPKLANWLEGEGYRNPDTAPASGPKNESRTAGIDDDFIAQYNALNLENIS